MSTTIDLVMRLSLVLCVGLSVIAAAMENDYPGYLNRIWNRLNNR